MAPSIRSAGAVVYPVAAGGGAVVAVFGTRYSSHTGSTSYEISLQKPFASRIHRVASVVASAPSFFPTRKTAP